MVFSVMTSGGQCTPRATPATRERVVVAARQLGVPRMLPDLRRGLTRLDVILARSPAPYF